MDKALAVALVLLAPAGASAQAANWFQIYDKIDGFSLYMSNQYAVVDERRIVLLSHVPVEANGRPDYSQSNLWFFVSDCRGSSGIVDTRQKGTDRPINFAKDDVDQYARSAELAPQNG
jgi:hypothetical protein